MKVKPKTDAHLFGPYQNFGLRRFLDQDSDLKRAKELLSEEPNRIKTEFLLEKEWLENKQKEYLKKSITHSKYASRVKEIKSRLWILESYTKFDIDLFKLFRIYITIENE